MAPEVFVQLGVAGAALWVLFKLLSPVMKAHVHTLDRVADTMAAATEALHSIQQSQVSAAKTLEGISRDNEVRIAKAKARHAEVMASLRPSEAPKSRASGGE